MIAGYPRPHRRLAPPLGGRSGRSSARCDVTILHPAAVARSSCGWCEIVPTATFWRALGDHRPRLRHRQSHRHRRRRAARHPDGPLGARRPHPPALGQPLPQRPADRARAGHHGAVRPRPDDHHPHRRALRHLDHRARRPRRRALASRPRWSRWRRASAPAAGRPSRRSTSGRRCRKSSPASGSA